MASISSSSKLSGRAIEKAVVPAIFLLAGALFWKLHILDAPKREVSTLTVDLYQQFQPWYSYMASSLRNLTIPLWFPYAGAGVPFLATPSTAVFYPPNLAYLLLPVPLAMGLIAVFHLTLAATGTYAFCRQFKLAVPASIFGGIAYMLSNAVWINYINPHYLAGVALLPVVFLLAERLYFKPSLSRSLMLSIPVTLQFLSGAGQFFLYTIYFLFLYLALRAVFERDGENRLRKNARLALFFAFSFVLAGMLCSIQLLPSLEMLKLSVRSEPLSKELVHFADWYVPWWWPFLNLLYSKWTWLLEYLFHQGGLLQVFFLLLVITRLRDRRLHIFLILFIVSVILSTGYSTPLYNVFAFLPGIGASRQPNRIAVVTAFALAFLSAFGMDHCLHMAKEQKQAKRILHFAVVAGFLGLLLYLVSSHGKIMFLGAGLAFLLVAVSANKRWLVYSSLAVVIFFGAWELAGQHRPTSSHPQAMPDYLTPAHLQMLQEVKSIVGNERIYVEERGVPPRPFSVYRGAVEGLYAITDYHPAISSRMEDLIEAIAGSRPLYPDGRIVLSSESHRPDILSLFSVRYLLMHKRKNVFEQAAPGSPMAEFSRGLRVVRDFPGYILYENAQALPRTYVVKRVAIGADRFETVRELLSIAPYAHLAAVLEGEEARQLLPLLNHSAQADSARIESCSPNEVVVDVTAADGGILVLTDSYYPGWKAKVDGAPAHLYRANYLFRGVYVPPGQHKVIFLYKPVSFLVGLVLSAIGLVLLTSGFIICRRKIHIADALDGEEVLQVPPASPERQAPELPQNVD